MHSCLTFQSETKRTIQSELKAGIHVCVLLLSLAMCQFEETTFFFFFSPSSMLKF